MNIKKSVKIIFQKMKWCMSVISTVFFTTLMIQDVAFAATASVFKAAYSQAPPGINDIYKIEYLSGEGALKSMRFDITNNVTQKTYDPSNWPYIISSSGVTDGQLTFDFLSDKLLQVTFDQGAFTESDSVEFWFDMDAGLGRGPGIEAIALMEDGRIGKSIMTGVDGLASTLVVSEVPLPAALPLFLSALVSLRIFARRRVKVVTVDCTTRSLNEN